MSESSNTSASTSFASSNINNINDPTLEPMRQDFISLKRGLLEDHSDHQPAKLNRTDEENTKVLNQLLTDLHDESSKSDGFNDMLLDSETSIKKLFDHCRSSNEVDNTTTMMSGTCEDSYITIEEFNNVRLNKITTNNPIELKATIEHFGEFLEKELRGYKLHVIFDQDHKNSSQHYKLLYTLLLSFFSHNLSKNEAMLKNIIFILNSLVIYKNNLKETPFVNKINGIIKMPPNNQANANMLMKKTNHYLSQFLDRISTEKTNEHDNDNTHNNDGDENINTVKLTHFKGYDHLFDDLELILSLCNKMVRIQTFKAVNFKQMTSTKVEIKDSTNKAASVIKPARRLTLQTPILLKITTRSIGDGKNLTVYSCDDEINEYVIEQIKHSLHFTRKNQYNGGVDVKFYPSIQIGEPKKLSTMNMYETKIKANASNKDSLTDESYIVTDSFNIIYNENPNTFGISVKCWPLKHTIHDNLGNQVDAYILDFSHDKKIFDFLNSS